MEQVYKLLPSSKIVNIYDNRHIIIKCTVRELVTTKNIVNWEYNRPADSVRFIEIAKSIYNSKNAVDWLLYMSYDNKSDMIKIIDGLHRYCALKHIWCENHKPADFITPNEYGSAGDADWLYDKYILISMRCNNTMGELVDLFQSINKSNPIPELYMENNDIVKREIIEEVVKEWQKKYKTHFTSTSKPNIPNVNRDRFIDLLDFIYQKYNISKMNAQTLSEKLYEANNHIRLHIPKKISMTAIEKCKQTNCYLFLVKNDVLEKII